MHQDHSLLPPNSTLFAASAALKSAVHNLQGEGIGKIVELMLDEKTGQIAYAVLSFGGFLGFGQKLFAIPWTALRLDEEKDNFVLEIDRDTLKAAPGFDEDNWPDFSDQSYLESIRAHYGDLRGFDFLSPQ